MLFQSLILSSILLLAPLLDVVSAYPQPISPGVIVGGNRPGTCQAGQCGRKPKPDGGPDIPETEVPDLTGSGGPSSGEPESDIFHAPDGADGDSTCQNRLPETLLFSVEKGHDCVRMANIYNDQNTYAKFNCKPAEQQKTALCGEEPHFGALAENCYNFLKQNHPREAEEIRAYVRLCQ